MKNSMVLVFLCTQNNVWMLKLKARNVWGRNEVNMDMIFEYLSEYSEEERNRLRFLEEKCEIDNCIGNPLMIEVWKWCRDNGKKIVIITDMYLPLKGIRYNFS